MAASRRIGWFSRLAVYLLAVTACQFLVGAFWTQGRVLRRAQQRALRTIGGNSPSEGAASQGPKFGAQWKKDWTLGLRIWVGTTLLTAPGLLLMWAGWYAGWQVSFHKMYEYSAVGVGLFALGMTLFATAMFSVPVASARAGVTQQLRTFFEFRTNHRIVQGARFAQIGLASAYALAAIPLWFLVVALPLGLGNGWEGDFVSGQEFVPLYHWLATLILYPIYGWLRHVAARAYSQGLRNAVRQGRLDPSDLETREVEWLERARLANALPRVEIPKWRRAIGRTLVFIGGGGRRLVTFFLWVALAFGLLVSQFFRYTEFRGWAVHPLVHAPWFSYGGASSADGADYRALEKSQFFIDGIDNPDEASTPE